VTARVSGARAARTPAARKAAAGAGRVAPFAPMSFAKREDAEVDRIPLFEVDGVEYTVPAVVPTGTALALLLNTQGLSEARRGAVLIEALAGNAALNALLGQAEMTDADWHKLITIVSEHAFGRLEEPGN
jgi:hypothetical protein